jgi:hypothetical protein
VSSLSDETGLCLMVVGSRLGLINRAWSNSALGGGHEVVAHTSSLAVNRLKVWLPLTEVQLSIVQDLASLLGVLESWTSIAWHDWGII